MRIKYGLNFSFKEIRNKRNELEYLVTSASLKFSLG